jgi:hypothetical protein
MILKPKNWKKFQHYKDRNPPWIKVHKDQLDDPDFMSLSLASVGLAQFLWLLASESKDGSFTADMKKLMFRLRKTEVEVKKHLTILIETGFFEVLADGSTVLASDTGSCSEGETEGETEYKPDFSFVWDLYPNKDGKKSAEKSFLASVKTETDYLDILFALNNYKDHLEVETWKKPKNGSTWFNNWRDWLEWKQDAVKKSKVKTDAYGREAHC